MSTFFVFMFSADNNQTIIIICFIFIIIGSSWSSRTMIITENRC